MFALSSLASNDPWLDAVVTAVPASFSQLLNVFTSCTVTTRWIRAHLPPVGIHPEILIFCICSIPLLISVTFLKFTSERDLGASLLSIMPQ